MVYKQIYVRGSMHNQTFQSKIAPAPWNRVSNCMWFMLQNLSSCNLYLKTDDSNFGGFDRHWSTKIGDEPSKTKSPLDFSKQNGFVWNFGGIPSNHLFKKVGVPYFLTNPNLGVSRLGWAADPIGCNGTGDTGASVDTGFRHHQLVPIHVAQGSENALSVGALKILERKMLWRTSLAVILLMGEILHHLGWLKPYK